MKLIAWVLGLPFRLAGWMLKLVIHGLLALAGFNPKAKYLKTRALAFFLAAGLLQAPLYMGYAIQYPARFTELSARMGVGFYHLYSDVRGAVLSVVPQEVKDASVRYQLPAYRNMTTEAVGMKSVPWYHRVLSPWRWVR